MTLDKEQMQLRDAAEPREKIARDAVSTYLDFLPAIFQETLPGERVPLVGRLLLAFEAILSGIESHQQAGLEQVISTVYRYFDPMQTDEDFLPWLSRWVALTLREDWTAEEKRRFINQVVPLYRLRGTRNGLKKLLMLYTEMDVEIEEFTQGPLQVGVESRIGQDTVLGYYQPHYFYVKVYLGKPTGIDLERRKQITRDIIDQEKPAHTCYDVEFIIPTLEVGSQSRVGVDTLLGQDHGRQSESE